MSVGYSSHGGEGRGKPDRASDLSAAGLALSRLALDVMRDSRPTLSPCQSESMLRATEQLISAIGSLRDLVGSQRAEAAEILDELIAFAAELDGGHPGSS